MTTSASILWTHFFFFAAAAAASASSAAFSASASLAFFFVQNVQSHVCAIDSWCLIMCSNSPRSDLLFARKRVRAAVREKAPNCLRCTSRQHA